MDLRIVGAIIKKDLRLFSRDLFYAMMTGLGLVIYVAMFWVLPSSVDETLRLGVHAPGLADLIGGAPVDGPEEGLAVVTFDSTDALREAVAAGTDDLAAGLDLPEGFVEDIRAGQRPTITVFLTGDAPPEIRDTIEGFVGEIAYAIAGIEPPVVMPALEDVVIGTDRAGDQLSLQDRFRPLFAFLVLMIETFALAGLVANEISGRTVVAILVTPATTAEFLLAKVAVGTGLAFSQAVLLLALIGALGSGALTLLVAILLGSLLVTGVGLLAGSTGRDFLGIVFWSMLFIIPLTVPAIAGLFPGAAAAWVRALPTYGLVSTITAVTVDNASFGAVAGDLAVVAVWCVVVLGVGLVVLRRKVATL
jgi:ABC-2 type transport system permease protein